MTNIYKAWFDEDQEKEKREEAKKELKWLSLYEAIEDACRRRDETASSWNEHIALLNKLADRCQVNFDSDEQDASE